MTAINEKRSTIRITVPGLICLLGSDNSQFVKLEPNNSQKKSLPFELLNRAFAS